MKELNVTAEHIARAEDLRNTLSFDDYRATQHCPLAVAASDMLGIHVAASFSVLSEPDHPTIVLFRHDGLGLIHSFDDDNGTVSPRTVRLFETRSEFMAYEFRREMDRVRRSQ